MSTVSFREMFRRLISAEGQRYPAKTVEVFGWLILLEGSLGLFAPHLVESLLGLPPLGDQYPTTSTITSVGLFSL